jgi:hypoxanthine-DNA glycosylase
MIKSDSTNSKRSFEPISNAETRILILGTLPGDKSLELSEYYGNSRNKFWKIISNITNSELPQSYSKKKELLFNSKIGVWDVAYTAHRIGSLDSTIKEVIPNDLENFIANHKKLKVIGFNGTKSESLFNIYFKRKDGINYILLPSSSPANTVIKFDSICDIWSQILKT